MTINHRRISISIVSGFVLEIINRISPLVILHHAQKSLGLVGFGDAQYRLALLESIQPFVTFGFTNFAMNEQGVKSGDVNSLREVFTHIFWLKVINAIIVACFVLFTFDFHKPGEDGFNFYFILFMLFSALVSESLWYVWTKHKYASMNFVLSALRIGSLVCIISKVKSSADRDLFVLLSLLPNIVISIMTGVYAFKELRFSKLIFDKLKDLFIRSWPYTIVWILLTMIDRIDLLLVKKWFGLEAAGIYTGPAKIVQSLSFLVSALAVPLFAEMIKVDDKDELSKHVSLSAWITTALIAPMIFGIPFVEFDFLEWMFTDLPSSSSHLLGILGTSLFGGALIIVYGLQLQMSKSRPWNVVWGASLGLAFTVVFTWFAKDYLFLKAPAIAISSGKMIFGITCYLFSRDLLDRFPFASFAKPLAAGALMALALFLVGGEGIIINVVIGGITYLGSLVLLNYNEIREFKLVEKIFKVLKIK